MRLTLIFGLFTLALVGLSAVQLCHIDRTLQRLRLERQWDEIQPFVREVRPAMATLALPLDIVPEYQGPDAHRFVALWADGALVSATSASLAMRLVAVGGGRPPLGTVDIWPTDGGQVDAHILTKRIDGVVGSRLLLSVGHTAWSSDVVLRTVETKLLRQMLMAAFALSGVTAVVVVLVVRRRLAPVRWIAQDLGAVDPARALKRFDREALPSEMRVLTGAVEDALDRLDRSVKRHRRLSADAAHQLLTPLSILQARLEAADGSVASSELRGDITRMTRIVGQLLRLARHAERDAAREAVDLRQLCETVIGEIAPLAVRDGKEVALEAPAVSCQALCNPDAIGEALTNLLQNALDHTQVGGCVDVIVSPALWIRVADRGPGFSMDDEEQLFQPFFTTRSGSGGSGLGLAIAREIMQSHGGSAHAERREGGGAVFTLDFAGGEYVS